MKISSRYILFLCITPCLMHATFAVAQSTRKVISYEGHLIIGLDDNAKDNTDGNISFDYKTSSMIIASDTAYFIAWSGQPANLLANVISDDSPPQQGTMFVNLINNKIYDLAEQEQFSVAPRMLTMVNDSVIDINGTSCRRYIDISDLQSAVYYCASSKKTLTLFGILTKEDGFCVWSIKKSGMVLNRVTTPVVVPPMPVIHMDKWEEFRKIKSRFLF